MIVVERGKHHNQIPKGLETLVEEFLSEAGISKELDWKIQFGKNVKGTAHTPRFKVKGLGPGDSFIELYLKPGNNTTAHLCHLKVDKGNKTDLKSLHDTLKEWEEAKGLKKPSTNGSANGHSVVTVGLSEKPKENPQHLGKEKEQVVVKKSKSELVGFAGDPEKVCIFLLELDLEKGADSQNGWINSGKCREVLGRVVGQKLSKKALGATIASISRKGYLERNAKSATHQAFRISAKGRSLIKESDEKDKDVTVVTKTIPASTIPNKKVEGQKTKPSASELALEAELKELNSQMEENRQQMVLLENRADAVQKALKILRGLE